MQWRPNHRTVMSHQFSQIPDVKLERSRFDRSHGYKTTFNAGYLIPVFVDEVLPGDTFSLHMTSFSRLATPIVPLMDNMYLESFFFFVPNRLVWTHWEKFNGAQDNPGDSTSFTVPISTSPGGGYGELSLQDYMGLPTKIAGYTHTVLHTRAYNLIWNTWFRDENLQNSVTVDVGDGPDTVANYVLLQRGKRHDYFTSALPWPQKGTAVTLPLGSSAPLTLNSAVHIESDGSQPNVSSASNSNMGVSVFGTANPKALGVSAAGQTTDQSIGWGNNTGLRINATDFHANAIADLSTATAATINQIRQAFQIQKLYERDARGGTRYVEILRSHFGTTSPDFRLQRPEFLGGGRTPIMINPVPQTAGTGASGTTTPQGNLSAFGIVNSTGHGFTKSFVEHGVIIGLVCARADLNYQQGLNRMWSRSIRWDFYWPALAHLGEQTVLNQEIYCQGTGADANVFGYQERYAEYRYKPSLVTGRFRSNASTPLDMWHLAQNFGGLPTLGSTFIVEAPPMSRVKAVSSEPDFLFDAFINLKCARPMPTYSVPGLIDHF